MEEVNLMFPEKDNLDVQDELKAIIEKYLQTKDVISLWGRMDQMIILKKLPDGSLLRL